MAEEVGLKCLRDLHLLYHTVQQSILHLNTCYNNSLFISQRPVEGIALASNKIRVEGRRIVFSRAWNFCHLFSVFQKDEQQFKIIN